MEKSDKKVYESKKIYGKKYNQKNIGIQLDRELVYNLRKTIHPLSIKEFLENLIRESI